MKHKTLALVSLLAVAFCTSASAAVTEVQAKIVRANGDGKEMQCLLRWLPADKKYVVVNPKTKAEMRVDPSEVAGLVVATPRNWEELRRKAGSATPEAALSGLKALAVDYRMLQWDAEAGRLIAEILLRKNQFEQAVKECEDIIRNNPAAAYDSPMAPAYWEALIAAKKTSSLPGLFDKGAMSASRTVAAMACLRRGDMFAQEGKLNDALKDGYLRCVFLFPREADARAEALYKAAQAFDQLHKATYAEKMRQQLLSSYGNSRWAREASGGAR